jgi:hypothetical protein
MEFWFEFDNFFNPRFGQLGEGVREAYDAIGSIPGIRDTWHEHRRAGTYPDGFRQDMQPKRDGLLQLADQQLAIFDRHFSGDDAAEQAAFEEFGQGLNFDDRRPVGQKVHKMDPSGPGQPPAFYHVWHAFIRAFVLLGADAQRWLGLDRKLALAWVIQNEAQPKNDRPDNPPLPPERLETLRKAWLGLSVEELDDAFDHDPLPPVLSGP